MEADMEFVQKFTPLDIQAKNFTPSISPNFNSFSGEKQKMSENGEIYTAGKKFTLPPAVTAWTNLTSANPFFNSGVKVKCKVLKSNICSYRKNCFVELTELFGFCLLKVILLGRRASLSNKLESEKTSKGLQKRQGLS